MRRTIYDLVYDMMADVLNRKLSTHQLAKAVQENIAPAVNFGKGILIRTHVTHFGQ